MSDPIIEKSRCCDGEVTQEGQCLVCGGPGFACEYCGGLGRQIIAARQQGDSIIDEVIEECGACHGTGEIH